MNLPNRVKYLVNDINNLFKKIPFTIYNNQLLIIIYYTSYSIISIS